MRIFEYFQLIFSNSYQNLFNAFRPIVGNSIGNSLLLSLNVIHEKDIH